MEKEVKNESGIYYIKNLKNNKIYVGQSVGIRKRLIHHKHQLIQNKHSNSHLQRSFNKHGLENFEFKVLEYCNKEILTEKEKHYLSNLNYNYYNIRDASDSVVHNKRSSITEETRLKLSEVKKGKKPSNLENIQQERKRKVAYYLNNELIKIFNSCKEAADYFDLKPNAFNYYIGKTIFKRSSKYFVKHSKFEYYE